MDGNFEKEFVRNDIDEKKEKEQLANMKRLYDELLTQRARMEILIDSLKGSIVSLPPLERETVPEIRTKFSAESAVLMLSDCQIGTLIDPEEAGEFGEYNMQIFSKQLKKLAKEVLDIISKYRKTIKIKKLYIFGLGDIVENERTFKNQAHHIATDVYNQWAFASREIAEFINTLSVRIDIECDLVFGNHGAVSGSKDITKNYVNWDLLTYKMIEQYLSRNDHVTFEIPKKWWMLKEVEGFNFYLIHGEDFKRYMKYPYYNVEFSFKQYIALMQKIGKKMDYLVYGH